MDRIQDQINTSLFREMPALRTARQRLATTKAGEKLRILSFGCSIGDEIVTLRTLFPTDIIFGCDVFLPAMAIAQATTGHDATVFISNAANLAAFGPFDLIVASAVLCLNPPKEIERRFPFSRFEDAVGLLDASLSPGGVLVITNASYRFQETSFYPVYDTIRSEKLVPSGRVVDVLAKSGSSFMSRVVSPSVAIFRRGPGFAVGEDEEIVDCVFEKHANGGERRHHALTLTKAPRNFFATAKFERKNTDALLRVPSVDTIVISQSIQCGIDTDTGAPCYVSQLSWPSFLRDELHFEPKSWGLMQS